MNRYVQSVGKYFEEILAGGFAVAATGILMAGMCSRWFLKEELWWSEEAATICFIWGVFLGVAAVYKRGIHIGVDLFVKRMPEGAKAMVNLLVRLILTVINGALFWLSTEYVLLAFEKRTEVLGVSYAWLGGAVLVSFALTTWYSIRNLLFYKNNNRKRGEA